MSSSIGRQSWDAEITLSQAAAQLRHPAQMTSPYDADPLDLTIFISCYNEAEYIIATIETVIGAAHAVGLSHEILVIDDGSREFRD